MNWKALFTTLFFLFAAMPIKSMAIMPQSAEVYEGRRVGDITIEVENLPRGVTFNQKRLLSKLRTKVGDPFSQLTFDQDLKMLSEEYDKAIPTIETGQGEVYITIELWQKPMIRAISWSGNTKVKTRSLERELGIKAHTIFNREEFNKAFTKLKEYYVKKGYFDSQLEYKVIPYTNTNEVDIEITVHEGHSGHIKKICFSGLTKQEESAILNLMTTKKYNFFTSWLTGMGTYHEEALEHDKLVIVNYLQNQGYADARVNIQIKESTDENSFYGGGGMEALGGAQPGRLEIYVHAIKGELFHFGDIEVSGNELLTEEQITDVMIIKDGSTFSPEKLRESIENIKDLYGKDGYIETDINYSLYLSRTEPVYNVDITINEGEQFKIGLIRVLGNTSTNKNVILRESLLIPGEVFDSRRLKVTQQRLEAMGYFKSVNVYAVKTPEDQSLGDNYRDVIIEVEETTTGSLSLFFGFSTIDNLFGGLDLAENNFDHRGLTKWWREGMSSFRGAGEYAHARVQIGKKQQSYTVTWMDPYFRDTLWRFGLDISYSKSGIQSDDYHVNSFGGSLFGSYPLTSYWTYGWKLRLRNSITHINNIANEEAQRERKNSGLIGGFGNSLSFDSLDNAFKPHRGFRSIGEVEIAGVRRHDDDQQLFPFLKLSYLNSYYYPVWRKGTLKFRWDFKFICPFGNGTPDHMPLGELFFLGGETTVRGYKPYIIGPHFTKEKHGKKEETDDPTGGVSSALLSIEYNQTIFSMLDLFTFLDGGSISNKRFDVPTLRTSYGFGARLNLAGRLPITLGVGFPINPQARIKIKKKDRSVIKKRKRKEDVKNFFISMGGQF
ncbi:outer membrane protein assembly factor BamA [Candidatus Neptunochlamydia vexilliferae]|nr:outer membrane protein assembly factor BamA [Candidatus Neptunochlamydia vexilliferae]